MNILKLATAAAIALSSLSVPAAASAQRHDRGDRWGHDNGRHNGWRNNNRHRRQVCRWTWRNHHRVRVCRWVRR